MPQTTRAIFFDLGGTLFSNLEIPRVCFPVLEEAARRLEVEGGIATLGPAFIEASRRANQTYVDRPYYLHRDLFVDTCRYIAEHFGREATDDYLQWFYEAQRKVMVEQLNLRNDCLSTLERLRGMGLTLAIVSNIDDDYLDPMVENLGLRPFFTHVTSSQEAGSCKPDASIFHWALRKAECAPEDVLFVGDSRVHDIQGARAVGIESVLISEEGGRSHLDDADHTARPDHEIGALSQLIPIVEER